MDKIRRNRYQFCFGMFRQKKEEDVFSEGNFVEMGRSYFLVAGGRLSLGEAALRPASLTKIRRGTKGP